MVAPVRKILDPPTYTFRKLFTPSRVKDASSLNKMKLNSSGWAFIQCVNRSYHLPFRLQKNTRKRTSITQCLVNWRKYTSRRNPSIGKTPLEFLNSSTCIAVAKSIHQIQITIFHVGKHKRHFSNNVQLTLRSQRKLKLYCVRTMHAARISYAVNFIAHLPAESLSCETIFKDEGVRELADRYSAWTRKKTTLFSCHYLRIRSTLDLGVLGYIGIV